ncbi:hypothetical protein Plhal304r1_c026g0087971 [Plasmopara halstedii]
MLLAFYRILLRFTSLESVYIAARINAYHRYIHINTCKVPFFGASLGTWPSSRPRIMVGSLIYQCLCSRGLKKGGLAVSPTCTRIAQKIATWHGLLPIFSGIVSTGAGVWYNSHEVVHVTTVMMPLDGAI